MTDGAFSLSPPGSFPLSADPAFQDEVRGELERLIARVRESAAAPSVAGVLLTGSFSRGEGTVIGNGGSHSRWLSDVECLVVVRGGIVPRQEIQRSMRQIERDTNSDGGSIARGIKVELRAILTEGMLRLRPAIFTRELCEHAKLLWGDPAAIPVPPASSSEAEISKHDAFRLLNNRIIEQIAVRSEYADRTGDSTVTAYSLAKFWIDLALRCRFSSDATCRDIGAGKSRSRMRSARIRRFWATRCAAGSFAGSATRWRRSSATPDFQRGISTVNLTRRSKLRAPRGTGKAGNCWARMRRLKIGAGSSRG